MIPYTYQEMKKFACAECGTEFESGSPQAKYCTITCQRRAKQHRRIQRDTKGKPLEKPEHDDRFADSVKNPTTRQLDKYAELILTGTFDKPMRFFGEVPYWISPNGIVLAEQFGVEPRQWIMQKTELGIMDVLMNKS